MTEVEPVVRERCLLGESPLWSPAEQALYWIDVRNAMIRRLDPATGAVRRWPLHTDIGAIALTRPPNRLLAAMRCGIGYGFVTYDLEADTYEQIVDPEPDNRRMRLNDGKMDRQGRFWCGTMRDPHYQPIGRLYRLDADGGLHERRGGITVPNALCFSPDGRTMYFADSPTRRILAFDYDPETGEPANERVFAEVPEGGGAPDGATVDAEGFLWNAQFGGGCVTRYDPDGKVERRLAVPARQVTSCAFGGPELATLYVTTATLRYDRAALEREPLAGALFACEPGARGLPEMPFGG